MNIRFIYRRRARLALLAIAALPPLFAGMAHAQSSAAPSPSASPSPAQMTKSAPVPYRSAMDGYKPYTDEKVIDWKQANDSTGRIGGWREYAKEAQQPDAANGGAKPAPDVKPVKP